MHSKHQHWSTAAFQHLGQLQGSRVLVNGRLPAFSSAAGSSILEFGRVPASWSTAGFLRLGQWQSSSVFFSSMNEGLANLNGGSKNQTLFFSTSHENVSIHYSACLNCFCSKPFIASPFAFVANISFIDI